MYFRVRPLQRFGEVLDCPGVHTAVHIPLHEFPQEFEARVSRPAINRYRERFFFHVYETCLFVPRLEFIRNPQWSAERHGSAILSLCPFEKLPFRRHRAVVAVYFGVDLVGLHVAPGLEVIEALLYDCAEVFEDAEGHAGVDVVVGLRAVPPFFAPDVVDEEVDVGGRAGAVISRCYWGMLRSIKARGEGSLHVGLDGGEVDAFDLVGVRRVKLG